MPSLSSGESPAKRQASACTGRSKALEKAPLGLVAAQEMQHQQNQRRIARRRRR
ncbi:hypothetical protein [Pseudomonas aeruginosa]|uniref:hypothetical protein n=1 Tax=Pseudomonas aeruginosa TaxID=287 RepID=UPI000A8A07E8|nr:hypothetical protein [Pseudomonas aeruginosa]